MKYFICITACILSYLLGSISSSVIISKKISGKDIRSFGSGNAGATNMLRTHGAKAGVLTLLCDAAKGVIAVLLGIGAESIAKSFIPADWFTVNILMNLRFITGVFVVIGHIFPIFFRFRGGKGVATGLGVILTLNPTVGVTVMLTAVLIMALTRYVSLGSVIGAILYPVSTLVFMAAKKEFNAVNFICALILCVILIAKHHTNIKRLLEGKENKLFEKKGNLS